MENIVLSVSREDIEWVKNQCKEESINVTTSESDGLIGSSELLDVVIPLAVATIPCLTKILLKLIEKCGPTKVSCGDITVESVSQKDVSKVLDKMCDLQKKMNKKDG